MLLWIFSQSFKHVKTILISWTVQKQTMGQVWLMCHSLPCPRATLLEISLALYIKSL